MNLFEELKALGVDVDDGMKRLMGNEGLYRRMLGKFVNEMGSKSLVSEDFDKADHTSEIEIAHSIKGVAGNLSLTPIFESYNEILSLLRTDRPEEAKAVLEKVLPIQKEIISCIQRNME